MLLPFLLLAAANSIRPDVAAATAVPYRQPQLASAQGIVAMAFGGGTAIYFTQSKDQGQTFLAPVKVAETGSLALGRHRGPRVAVLKDAIVISAIHGEKVATGAHAHGLPEAGNLTAWRSTDQGKTWTKAGPINDVPGAAREGLHAMAASPDGKTVFATWLDLRNKGTQLWGSKSTDGGKTWSKNVAVYTSPDGTICQCCHPSLLLDAKGVIRVMWRNVMSGSRDMYVASSADGVHFETAAKQGSGTWKLNACPMDGGGFAVREDGKIVSVWRRDTGIFLSEPGESEKQVGVGKDVALAYGKKGAYLAWTQDGGIMAKGPQEAVKLAKDGGFATLLALDGGKVLVAWESQGAIETRIIE